MFCGCYRTRKKLLALKAMRRGFLSIALPEHTCTPRLLVSCLSCLTSLTGDKQDCNYESHGLSVQHNTQLNNRKDSNYQDTSWLLHYIIFKLHWFFEKTFILQISITHIHPRKPKVRLPNSRTSDNLGYSKRQLICRVLDKQLGFECLNAQIYWILLFEYIYSRNQKVSLVIFWLCCSCFVWLKSLLG